MIIIGIDPGSRKTGWGIVESRGSFIQYVASGVIVPKDVQKISERLEEIFKSLVQVVERYGPEEGAVEDVFYCKNAKSALILGYARGISLLALRTAGCPKLYQYSPKKIKMSVVGTGSADKRQIQHMVRIILGMKKDFRHEDESDALASAICHANNRGRLTMDVKSI
ncbi:MAG: crossover junction endodeoxyribonuclease RuvC [Candidatus Aureabacteria bacterium]|nr:crossover junction endodeoxyribonuclease RuvC [Candidatus Auribacterota bacterium]